MSALSVASPTMTPRARGHVPAVIRLATALLERGAAYEADGHVYFRGADVPGRLGSTATARWRARRSTATRTTSRAARTCSTWPVWRPSPEDHPAWPSPWGWGRPGWHAECTAMALTTLGSTVDV